MDRGWYRLIPTGRPLVYSIGARLPAWRVWAIRANRACMKLVRRRARWGAEPRYLVLKQRRRMGVVQPAVE